jgi:hypothetical protein
MLTPEQIQDKLQDKNFKNPLHAYDGHEVEVPADKLKNIFGVREHRRMNYATGNFVIDELIMEELRDDVKEYLRGQGPYNYQMVKERSIDWYMKGGNTSDIVGAVFRFARSSTAITFKLAYL